MSRGDLQKKREESGRSPGDRQEDRDQTREDRKEDRESGREERTEDRESGREDRQTFRDEQAEKRRGYAEHIHEERKEFVEHYGYPYYRYPYPYYGGSSVFISITTYQSYSCTKSTVVVDGKTYQRCDSGWYDKVSRDGDVQYVPVAPPNGAEVERLESPDELQVGGETFYLSQGSYYKKLVRDGKTRYVVVDAPLGYEVTELPKDAIQLSYEGRTYYQYGKVFYRPAEGGSSYVLVPPPY